MSEQKEMLPCALPSCGVLFAPKTKDQRFHAIRCRSKYTLEVGMQSQVAGVTRLKRGRVSVVTHYETGPAAERAIQLQRGDILKSVKVEL